MLASEENKDILQGFIYDFFDIQPKELIIENPYSIDDYMEILEGEEINVLRQTCRDISASILTANITVELQIRKSIFFDERSLYYPFDRYCQNYNKPEKMKANTAGTPNRYSSLRPVYALNILAYNHFQDNDALRMFELYDPKRHKNMNKELIKIGFFELTKDNIETPNQRHWCSYFLTGEAQDEAPGYIKKAANIIEFVNLRKEEQNVAVALEKALALYEEGLVDSFHEGKTEGKAEGKAEIAIKLLKSGMPPELVAEYTDLPIDIVMKWKETNL